MQYRSSRLIDVQGHKQNICSTYESTSVLHLWHVFVNVLLNKLATVLFEITHCLAYLGLYLLSCQSSHGSPNNGFISIIVTGLILAFNSVFPLGLREFI